MKNPKGLNALYLYHLITKNEYIFCEVRSDVIALLTKLLDEVLTDEKENLIFKTRHGLDKDKSIKTLEETGKIFGMTRERVRQIEAKALHRLRKKVSIRKLNECYWKKQTLPAASYTPIEELDFSISSYIALKKIGCNYVVDVIESGVKDVRSQKSTHKDVVETLTKNGFELANDELEIDDSENAIRISCEELRNAAGVGAKTFEEICQTLHRYNLKLTDE